jgi:hypothetical protein
MSDARYLLSQAELCFRLASGPASARLAEELEVLGRALAREEIELEFAKEEGQRRVARLRYPRQMSQDSSSI